MPLDNRTTEKTLPRDGMERPAAPPTRPIVPPSLVASHGGGTRPPRVVTVDLTNARNDEALNVVGTCIHVRKTTNATDELRVKYEGEGDAVPFRVGDTIAGVAFNKLTISNDAVAAAVVTLLIFNELPGLPLQRK